jgi:hypothetical protein
MLDSVVGARDLRSIVDGRGDVGGGTVGRAKKMTCGRLTVFLSPATSCVTSLDSELWTN